MKKPLLVFSLLSLIGVGLAALYWSQGRYVGMVAMLLGSLVCLVIGVVGEKFNRG